MPQPAPERRHVFISYSHADRDWVERLKRMMAPLLRGSGQELRLWDDSQIEAGRKWREAIEVALAQARVAVLLVSDHFLASEAEKPRPPAPAPAPEPPHAGALQVFSVTTAQLVRESDGWQVERRRLEVRGRRVELGDGVSLPLIAIPAGEFVMGSPIDVPGRRDSEGPQRRVRLEGFLMGQTPITQAQWRAVAGLKPPLAKRWQRKLPLNPSSFSGQPDSNQRPVEHVSWHDAIEFCRSLSKLTGDFYTLPSEAQWEYACRAGTSTHFAFGENITPDLANYNANHAYANGPTGDDRRQTIPVRSFPANAWGLQDMHGNVWEWCLDHWHGSSAGAPVDGSAWCDGLGQQGDDINKSRLLRGGAWDVFPGSCRSAYRSCDHPDFAISPAGFRVVCLPQGPSLDP